MYMCGKALSKAPVLLWVGYSMYAPLSNGDIILVTPSPMKEVVTDVKSVTFRVS